MHRIAICDDNVLDRERIKFSLDNYFKATEYTLPHIKLYACGEDLVLSVSKKSEYDVIFLDVNMGGMNGLETARAIRRHLPDVFIVFVTAFLDYSLEGYKIGAFRYIIKNNLDISVKECMNSVRKKLQTLRPVLMEVEEGLKWVRLKDISYIESELRTVRLHMVKENIQEIYTKKGKLSDFEKKPSFFGLMRIHKSYLVNPTYIDSVRRYSIRLKTGEELVIPKARYKEVVDKYTAFRGAL